MCLCSPRYFCVSQTLQPIPDVPLDVWLHAIDLLRLRTALLRKQVLRSLILLFPLRIDNLVALLAAVHTAFPMTSQIFVKLRLSFFLLVSLPRYLIRIDFIAFWICLIPRLSISRGLIFDLCCLQFCFISMHCFPANQEDGLNKIPTRRYTCRAHQRIDVTKMPVIDII